jgi:ribulose-5-phosphate 4-epimerase/fuculose-1-phosphate aldolase
MTTEKSFLQQNGDPRTMPTDLAELRQELSIANRVLANEGVVDAFGHISVRHPDDPNRFLIARHMAAEIVMPEDILEFTLDSKPVTPTSVRLYSEMVIHGCIYQLRPEVHSVCHHHAIPVMPFCISGVELVPVMHLGATLGGKVPFWDSRDEFGDTPLVVATPEQGMSHARGLGPHWMVLLRRHGATVAGRSIRECVFRSIYTCRNAELQARAMAMGSLGPLSTLSTGEVEQCSHHSLTPRTLIRAWEYWTARLAKAEAAGTPANAAPAAKVASSRRASRKPSAAKKARPAKRAASARKPARAKRR